MFIGRQRELANLNDTFNIDSCSLAIIYGRRRIGKTRLIQEFAKGKKCVFFSAQESDRTTNLEALSRAIFGEETEDPPVYKDFPSALHHLSILAKDEKMVFVIDEFPYLVHSLGHEIISILQNFYDNEMQSSKLMVILSGSSVSFMENQVISSKNPLFGRARTIIRMTPLSYLEVGKWMDGYSPSDKALMYGITGGIPMYLTQMNPLLSVKENLLKTVFNPGSLLFSEPENLLRQEVRDVKGYNAIIKAIANGKTKFNEISDVTNLSSGALKASIDTLSNLGIIEKIVPSGEDISYKKGYYRIKDLFFNFWYFFVPRSLSVIESDRMAEFYDSLVSPLLNDYMGKVFEGICRTYVMQKASLPLRDAGAWWGPHHEERKTIEIDIVARSALGDEDILIGSCKYKESPVGRDEYEKMKDYAKALKNTGTVQYWFFSKSGFTEGMKAIDSINLVTLDDIYKE